MREVEVKRMRKGIKEGREDIAPMNNVSMHERFHSLQFRT